MPLKSLRPCAKTNCGQLTRERYCEDHVHIIESETRERNQQYDSRTRDKKSKDFYRSKAWKELRNLAFNRDNGLCQSCLKQGEYRTADVVHHIIEIKSDWEKRLDLNNLESICHKCHNKIHKKSAPGSNFLKNQV